MSPTLWIQCHVHFREAEGWRAVPPWCLPRACFSWSTFRKHVGFRIKLPEAWERNTRQFLKTFKLELRMQLTGFKEAGELWHVGQICCSLSTNSSTQSLQVALGFKLQRGLERNTCDFVSCPTKGSINVCYRQVLTFKLV